MEVSKILQSGPGPPREFRDPGGKRGTWAPCEQSKQEIRKFEKLTLENYCWLTQWGPPGLEALGAMRPCGNVPPAPSRWLRSWPPYYSMSKSIHFFMLASTFCLDLMTDTCKKFRKVTNDFHKRLQSIDKEEWVIRLLWELMRQL